MTGSSPIPTMARDRFEFGLIGTAEEIADYVLSLAGGLDRGEVSLESGVAALRLWPAAEVKLAVKVRLKAHRGKIKLALAWRCRGRSCARDLRVEVPASRRELVI